MRAGSITDATGMTGAAMFFVPQYDHLIQFLMLRMRFCKASADTGHIPSPGILQVFFPEFGFFSPIIIPVGSFIAGSDRKKQLQCYIIFSKTLKPETVQNFCRINWKYK